MLDRPAPACANGIYALVDRYAKLTCIEGVGPGPLMIAGGMQPEDSQTFKVRH